MMDGEVTFLTGELEQLEVPCLSVAVDVVELLRYFDDDEDRVFALLRRLKQELS